MEEQLIKDVSMKSTIDCKIDLEMVTDGMSIRVYVADTFLIRTGFVSYEWFFNQFIRIVGLNKEKFFKGLREKTLAIVICPNERSYNNQDDGHFLFRLYSKDLTTEYAFVAEFQVEDRELYDECSEPCIRHSQSILYDAGKDKEIIDAEADLVLCLTDDGIVCDVVDTDGEVIKTCGLTYQEIADELCK